MYLCEKLFQYQTQKQHCLWSPWIWSLIKWKDQSLLCSRKMEKIWCLDDPRVKSMAKMPIHTSVLLRYPVVFWQHLSGVTFVSPVKTMFDLLLLTWICSYLHTGNCLKIPGIQLFSAGNLHIDNFNSYYKLVQSVKLYK